MLLEKIPPQNIEAEQAVLGSMLLDRDIIDLVADFLRDEDFYRKEHRDIYNVIIFLREEGEPVDLVTVTERLRLKGKLDGVGGAAYLSSLASVVPTAANAVHYARIVAEKSLLRDLIKAASRIVQHAYEESMEVNDILDTAEKMIFDLTHRRKDEGFIGIKEILLETFDRLEKLNQEEKTVTGVPTFTDLDKLLSGLQKSDLIICAARPGMGKTSFCLNIAQNAAVRNGIAVAIFSLEMSGEQLALRLLSSEAMIDQYKLRTGKLGSEDWEKLTQAVAPLSRAPIYIDDTPGISPMEIRAKCRRLQKEVKNLGLVIIDYLQLIHSKHRGENRQQEISEISRSLKALARELKVPVLALSQLSRAVEHTQDKRPSLSHLRESGALEQDSDCVLFIHREDYFNSDSERKGIAEIIVAKHRNGPVGSVELAFLPEYTRFVDLAKEE